MLHFMRGPTVGAMLSPAQTDRQINMMKLIVTFCNFENAPKKTPK